MSKEDKELEEIGDLINDVMGDLVESEWQKIKPALLKWRTESVIAELERFKLNRSMVKGDIELIDNRIAYLRDEITNSLKDSNEQRTNNR